MPEIGGPEGGGGGIPSGLIAVWHGTLATIPAGWVICDGNNSTPNLLARFIQGVEDAVTDPGATGGEAAHTLTESEMPSHTHSYTGGTSSDQGAGTGTTTRPKGWNSRTSEATGGGSSHNNEPPYYDAAFIMKT